MAKKRCTNRNLQKTCSQLSEQEFLATSSVHLRPTFKDLQSDLSNAAGVYGQQFRDAQTGTACHGHQRVTLNFQSWSLSTFFIYCKFYLFKITSAMQADTDTRPAVMTNTRRANRDRTSLSPMSSSQLSEQESLPQVERTHPP
ncbi:hypothetical protein M758_9G022900 [Ceratodon purpureus]|nr:hypothetical protein M758_9G022900 [Ceratodon purpureus]